MTEGWTERANRAAWRLAEATIEPLRVASEGVVRQQEHGARLALRWAESATEMFRAGAETNADMAKALAEQSGKQADALRALSREATNAWMSLFFAPVRGYREGTRTIAGSHTPNGSGDGLPVEDYDRLSIEEIAQRLTDLNTREVEELKRHEQRNKNRKSLIEQFDRRLV